MGSCHSRKRLPDGSGYKVLEVLGEGAFAKVMCVKDDSRQKYALKIVVAPPERQDEAEREVYILKKLVGIPHVAQLHRDYSDISEKTENARIYMMMKLYRGGTLVDYAQRFSSSTPGVPSCLPEELMIPIIKQVCQGLLNIHNLQPAIVHRDIKPENIVLDVDLPDATWTLLDFGSAIEENMSPLNTKKEVADSTEEIERYTTPVYRAPEQINLTIGRRVTRKVDVWALGVTIYQIAYHKLPFESTLATVSGKLVIPSQPAYSTAFTNLLQMLFTLDPDRRPDIAAVASYLDQHWDTNGALRSNAQAGPSFPTSLQVAPTSSKADAEWVAEFN